MFKGLFLPHIDKMKDSLRNSFKVIDISQCYRFTCKVKSYTNIINQTILNQTNSFLQPVVNLEYINDSEFYMTSCRYKKAFDKFDSTVLSQARFDTFSDYINRFCIGLSIASFGRFWWHEFAWGKRFYKVVDEKDVNVKAERLTYLHPVGFNKEKQITYERTNNLDEISFLIAQFFVLASEWKVWKLIQYNYTKALFLFSLPMADISFYDEIFLCFYKCLENLCTVEILQKTKLSNEKKEMKKAMSLCGILNDEATLAFDEIYKIRCSVAAHGQSPGFKLTEFVYVNDIKMLTDGMILYIMLQYMTGAKDIKEIMPNL